jgi:hypothetical protein
MMHYKGPRVGHKPSAEVRKRHPSAVAKRIGNVWVIAVGERTLGMGPSATMAWIAADQQGKETT